MTYSTRASRAAVERSMSRRLDMLAEHNPQRPSRWAQDSRESFVFIRVLGGNDVLPSGYEGVKYKATAVENVPTLYDPNLAPTCIDGVGYGEIVETGEKVLIVHDATRTGYQWDLIERQAYMFNRDPVALPLASDSSQTVSCYTVWG